MTHTPHPRDTEREEDLTPDQATAEAADQEVQDPTTLSQTTINTTTMRITTNPHMLLMLRTPPPRTLTSELTS